jgi:fibronectin type 3 domain-containing protein
MDMMHAVSLAYPPVAPGGLEFDANTGTLSWTDNSLSETAFVVEKSVDGGGSWTEVGKIERIIYDLNTTGEILSFPVGDWAEGDQFRVVAQNTVGDTWDYSDPNLNEIAQGSYAFPVATLTAASEVVDTAPPPPAVPAAPTGLTATLQVGPQVNLAWTDNATDETGFVVERSDNGGAFSVLANLGADSVSYVDTTVLTGNSYDYRVAAFNDNGSSAFAVSNPVTVPTDPTVPIPPSDLEANFEDVPLINLVWADNSTDETGFLIRRSTDGVSFSDLASVGPDVSTYDDLAVSGNYTYTYQVAAFNDNGTSASAVSNSVLVPADATPPAAPSNLAASNLAQTSLTLNWQDNSNNELGFTVQRAQNNSFTKNLVEVSVGADVTFFDDTGLKRNTTYYYRVLAFNLFNDGLGPFPWSPIFNIRTPR